MKSALCDAALVFLRCSLLIGCGCIICGILLHPPVLVFQCLEKLASMNLWPRNITETLNISLIARSFSTFQRPVFAYKQNKCSCSWAKFKAPLGHFLSAYQTAVRLLSRKLERSCELKPSDEAILSSVYEW